jgi:hypothetical protein
MRQLAKLACMFAGTAMLGGCQSFPLTSWMFKGARPQAQTTELAGNSVGSLEEGKELLREGNISAAVASLRVARLDRARFGEASNALAIAYARLGRADLADRYFREAILAEPENDKYAANLLRLQGQVMLARTQPTAPAEPVGETLAPAVAAAATPVPLPSSDRLAHGTVDRISRTEVQVRSRPNLGNAPTAVVAYRDAPVAARSQSGEAGAETPAYPVRIRLPEPE